MYYRVLHKGKTKIFNCLFSISSGLKHLKLADELSNLKHNLSQYLVKRITIVVLITIRH